MNSVPDVGYCKALDFCSWKDWVGEDASIGSGIRSSRALSSDLVVVGCCSRRVHSNGWMSVGLATLADKSKVQFNALALILFG
jgi:hypothetical protein